MIRDQLHPINGWLYSQIRIFAELRGLDPEAVVEMWIRERLDAMPEIAELARLRAEHRKQADSEWKAKYAAQAPLANHAI